MKLRRMEVRVIETYVFAVPSDIDEEIIDENWLKENKDFEIEFRDGDSIEIEVLPIEDESSKSEFSRKLTLNEEAIYKRYEYDMTELREFFQG